MIQSYEALFLFIVVVLIVSSVSGLLIGMIQSHASTARISSTETTRTLLTEGEIIQVYDRNVYLRIVGGELRPKDISVTYNGSPVDVNIYIVRDKGDVNVLDRGDIVLLVFPNTVRREDCITIFLGPSTINWGSCWT